MEADVLNATTTLSTETVVKAIKLSEEQLAIAAAVKNRAAGNILVIARAGTGKTFLILQCLDIIAGRAAVVAFGNKIAKEIKGKIAKAGHRHAEGTTFHALGLRVLMALYPTTKVEGRGPKNAGYQKMTRIMNEVSIMQGEVGVPKYLRGFVKHATSMAMSQGFGVDGMVSAKDFAKWREMVAFYRIDAKLADDNAANQMAVAEIQTRVGRKLTPYEAREEIIKLGLRYAHACLNLSKKLAHEVISYDDMLWLPLLLNADLPSYDYVFVDEAQDSNPVRVEWAARIARKGRLIFVGDDKQSIFLFTGAMNSALEKIRERFSCNVFKMTVTFRCSKAVAALAAKMVPDYKAAETNAEGSVSYINEEKFAEMALVPGQDAIICRNTRPLVSLAYDLIGRNIPCHIEGKEIGNDLIMQIDMIDNRIKSVAKFLPRMDEWLAREIAKLTAADAEMEAEALADKIEAIRIIMAGLPNGSTVDDAKAKITSLFGDKDEEPIPTVALMTAHKSKGLEFHRVFGWGVTLYMPSKRATLEHELEQEFNLEYVLKTRAIMDYIEVEVVPPPRKF